MCFSDYRGDVKQVIEQSFEGKPTAQQVITLLIPKGEEMLRVPLKMNATSFHDASGKSIVGVVWVGEDMSEVTFIKVGT